MRNFAALAASVMLTPSLGHTAPIAAAVAQEGVTITEAGRPVFFYRTRPAPGAEPGRSNYLHPVYAPDGRVLTEERPADHLHQRGVFWSWHQVAVGGRQAADGWFMQNLTFPVRRTKFEPQPDGSGVLEVEVDWRVAGADEPVTAAREITRVTAHPLKNGRRRLDFDTTITAVTDGFSLGGSNDVKGYGGFSVRFVRPDRLEFTSEGAPVQPQNTAVAADRVMTFTWPSARDLPPYRAVLSCEANGEPITRWILRRELSMQNCVFPGRAPHEISKGQSLRLRSSLVIEPSETAP